MLAYDSPMGASHGELVERLLPKNFRQPLSCPFALTMRPGDCMGVAVASNPAATSFGNAAMIFV